MLEWLFGEPVWKQKLITVGEYKTLSVGDKLKYHKHKGHVAEHIKLEASLIALVKIKFDDLRTLYKIKKEDGKDFYLSEMVKFFMDNPHNLSIELEDVCIKLENGDELKLRVQRDCATIEVNKERVGFIIGYDNVVEWSSLDKREQILQAINKLDLSLEEKLIL